MSNYIICKRHMHQNDYAILFWGKDSQGYRYNVLDAGVYEDANKKINEDHYKDDQPVKCELVDMLTIDSVIENRILGKICRNTAKNRKLLGIKLSELRKGPTNWNSKAFCELNEFVKQNKNIVELVTKITDMKTWNSPSKHPKKVGYYDGKYESISGKIRFEECYWRTDGEGWYADKINKISNAWNLIGWKVKTKNII